jgi:hemolysin III
MKQKKYTNGEEFANALTHLLAALTSIYGIIVLSEISKTTLQFVSSAVFGISLFTLFIASFFYHSAKNFKTKEIFHRIDHSAIYVLIAGTYTPALLLTLNFPFSLVVLSIIWGLAITGIIFTFITLKSKYLATGLFLFLGWISLFLIPNIWVKSHLALWLAFGGGIFYSLGCIFYLMNFRYSHFIWHLFNMTGAGMHYFAIIELLKAVN